MTYATYPGSGGAGSAGVPTYTNFASFPSAATAGNGALAIALDTNILYESNGAAWVVLSDPSVTNNAITALTGDVTATGPGSVAATIANLAVTNAKIANSTIDLTSKVTGILPVANGGTNSSTALNSGRAMQSTAGAIVESAVTSTELGFVSGVTSAIQTQLNAKQATGNYITALTGDVTASGPGSVASTIANLAVTNAKIANNTIDLTAKVTGILPTANGGTGQNSSATFPASGVVVTEAASETLTNKTISGASNTLTVRAASDITGQLPIANGGTNAATANAGFNNLAPTTTKGDLIAFTTVNARVAVGTDGQILIADSSQTPGIRWGSSSNGNVRASEGAGTTTLTISDSQTQTFNLSAARTVKLPTTSVAKGDVWTIINPNAFKLTIQSSGANTILTSFGTRVILQANVATPTAAADWTIVETVVIYGRKWTTYAPTVNGVTVGTNNFYWLRNNASITIKGIISISATSASGVDIALPSGLTIDTNLVSNNQTSFGDWHKLSVSTLTTPNGSGVCYYGGANSSVVRLAYEEASNIYTFDLANVYLLNTDVLDIGPLIIPITEFNEA